MDEKNKDKIVALVNAYAQGKRIEYRRPNGWMETKLELGPLDAEYNAYRIKPQDECTPFKNVNDCMAEMVKHTPFGILKNSSGEYIPILKYNHGGISVISGCDEIIVETWANALENYTFVDNTPFGIKEDIENNKTERK